MTLDNAFDKQNDNFGFNVFFREASSWNQLINLLLWK